MDFESIHPSTVAITFFATRLAGKYGADLEGLRTLLGGLPGVIL